MPWEKCEVTWGNTAKNLPWTCVSGGSQTTHAMTRAAYAAAMDAKKKLQEIAAKKLGGKPEEYEVANERVFRKGGGAGHELWRKPRNTRFNSAASTTATKLPDDINKLTEASVAALAGQGLVAVAKDNYPRDGADIFLRRQLRRGRSRRRNRQVLTSWISSPSADVGTVIHPRALGGQMLGRSTLGIGHAIGQKWVFDPALRPDACQALPPQQAAHDSGCARRHAMDGAGHSGSGNAGGRARHRRAAGGRRVRVDLERSFGRARRRSFPACAGELPTPF